MGKVVDMMMQVYRVKCENPSAAMPAQFVFENDDSNVVKGFIYEVNSIFITIVLFEPIPKIKGVTVLEHKITSEQYNQYLKQALLNNPIMREHWVAALEKLKDK